jgi:uncharacterized metal-binding protein
MAGKRTQQTNSGIFWDATGNGNAIAGYQCVSLATSAEVTAALAAGVRNAKEGELYVATPVSAGFATRRVAGVTLHSARNGTDITFVTDGVADVMVNAAVAQDSIVVPAAAATRTNKQTPLTVLEELLIPVDPAFTVTYNLCMADDTAIPLSTDAANVIRFILGYALKAAVNQYEVIPVELDRSVRAF